MSNEPQPWQSWPPDEQLRHALKMIRQFYLELQGGESFCMDRGYGWSLDAEGYRREFIVEWFKRLPTLRERLPTLWAFIESKQTIGDKGGLLKEIDRARKTIG